MARKKSKSALPLALVILGVLALVAFAAGEAWFLLRTDEGRIRLARHLDVGDPAHLTRAIGQQVRRGIEDAGVPRDSVQERVVEGGAAPLRWRVGLKPDASLLQANWAITHALEPRGVEVLSGREERGADGAAEVVLLVGLPERPTHEIVLHRAPPPKEGGPAPGGRLALVLYGFADAKDAREWLALEAPFSAAISPGSKEAEDLFEVASEQRREVVVHLPMEPINYPQLDPGPGALLVTMDGRRITGTVKRWLDQAPTAVAVSNHMGSLATQDMAVISAIYRELKRRRMTFVHLQPVPGEVCRSLAAQQGVAYDRPDAVLDGEARAGDTKKLDARWKDLLEQARERRQMMVWVRATPTVRRWLAGATTPKRLGDVSLVPLSSVLRKSGRP